MDKLWPITARLDEQALLSLGDIPVTALARDYGTPLYIFDEATLRGRAAEYRAALAAHYPATAQAAYAAKAYLCTALAQLIAEEGLDLDVVSGGELYVALQAGFPPERIHFHGNNKSRDELAYALDSGIGRIVVDNFHELALLAELAASRPAAQPVSIWLRLAPGVSAHTHAHIQTGQEDTKFGFSIASGDAERAVVAALGQPALALVGFHSHIGSQIYEPDALALAACRLADFAAQMHRQHGFQLRELSPGGGWGVPMTAADPEAPIEPYVTELARAFVGACAERGLPLPHLVLEPGRSLIAPAGVALYRVGARKEIPGIRTYVSVDGGMADNIRPALYGAQYHALRVREVVSDQHSADLTETVTIAGRFCESGDVLIRDIDLPRLAPGDLLAVPMAGAYTLAMASNYNLTPRPAVVLVREGQARLIQRRETYGDLVARDLVARDLPLRRDGAGARRFTRYEALGNDYVVLDPADWPEPPAAGTIRQICDRHRGIGADGVLWGPMRTGAVAREPFGVRLYNPDGGEFEKSGNGLRIFARYLWDRRLPAQARFVIDTPVGPVTAHVLDPAGSRIAMDIGRVSFDTGRIGIAGPPREIIEEAVEVAGQTRRITAVTVGNPHCVVFVDEIPASSQVLGHLAHLAQKLGPHLEHLPLYPRRTNVQFAHALDPHTLAIAIWERGAGYTLASGTSSCAAAAAAVRTGRCRGPVTVQMPGGEMLVEFDGDRVRLTGEVSPVCEGTWLGKPA